MKLHRSLQLDPTNSPRKGWVARVIAIVLISMTIGLAPTPGWSEQPYQYYAVKPSNPQSAYSFALQDQDGKSFSLDRLRGKFVLLTFGFTHCANICPTILANLATTYKLLSPEEQARVQVVFISLDPSRDTSKVLKDYVPYFDQHFVGLTGTPDQIAAAAKAFGVESDPPAVPGGNFEHSAVVYVITPAGKWIALYGNRQLQNRQRVADDLRHFLALPPGSEENWQAEGAKVTKTQPASGRQLYLEQCASCHLENGRGIAGKYPSLVGSNWVTGAPNRLTTLVVNGVKGDEGADAQHAGVMPSWRTALTPADTAAVLTYIRQAWGNAAPAISARYVQDLSYKFATRTDFWSWKELEALPPDSNATASSF